MTFIAQRSNRGRYKTDQARTAPSPILMKLSTLVHLYEKCINPKFFSDLTSRGLAMEVESFGLEAKMLFFKCLQISQFSRYLRFLNGFQHVMTRATTFRKTIFQLDHFFEAAFRPLIFSLEYLKTCVLRFFSFFNILLA